MSIADAPSHGHCALCAGIYDLTAAGRISRHRGIHNIVCPGSGAAPKEATPATWLLPIQPAHAQAILDGAKIFEVRRRKPSAVKGARVLIYETAPTSAVVGSFECGDILELHPLDLWAAVRTGCPTSTAEAWASYFNGRELGWAIAVRGPRRLQKPITAASLRRVFDVVRPQDWVRWKHPWPQAIFPEVL